MNNKERIEELELRLKRKDELNDSSMRIINKIQAENLDLLGRVRSALLGIDETSSNTWGVYFYSLLRCFVYNAHAEDVLNTLNDFIKYSKGDTSSITRVESKEELLQEVIDKIKDEFFTR